LDLATNALQAMPNGGRLVCSTRSDPARHLAVIRVSDSGPGVSPAARDHLFEPFFTTRPDGAGLGLALSREVIVQHGGRVELSAADEGGATFTIELPVGTGS